MDGSLLQEVLFTVKLPLSFPVPLSFSLPCAYVTLEKDCCKMKMPLLEGTLKYYYADYKNYYYLPLEDEAVHKSVGYMWTLPAGKRPKLPTAVKGKRLFSPRFRHALYACAQGIL